MVKILGGKENIGSSGENYEDLRKMVFGIESFFHETLYELDTNNFFSVLEGFYFTVSCF